MCCFFQFKSFFYSNQGLLLLAAQNHEELITLTFQKVAIVVKLIKHNDMNVVMIGVMG